MLTGFVVEISELDILLAVIAGNVNSELMHEFNRDDFFPDASLKFIYS